MATSIKLALLPLTELEEGRARTFAIADLPGFSDEVDHLEDLRIAIARAGEVVYAIEDRCSHDNGPLGDGPVEGVPATGDKPARLEITCTRHGARFDLSTGKPTRMPAISPVQVFPTEVVDGVVHVDLSDA